MHCIPCNHKHLRSIIGFSSRNMFVDPFSISCQLVGVWNHQAPTSIFSTKWHNLPSWVMPLRVYWYVELGFYINQENATKLWRRLVQNVAIFFKGLFYIQWVDSKIWPMVCVVRDVKKGDEDLKGLDMFVVDGSGVHRLWVVCNVVCDDKVTKKSKIKSMCKVGLHSFYFNLCGVV